MSITQLEQWLKDAGYEYHCFVSYPRIQKSDGHVDEAHPITLCARQVKDALVERLRFSIPKPQVYLDVDLGGGVDWETRLRGALCRSLVMVAICSGIYYHPSHEWCGIEWAAMDALGQRRLRGSDLRNIFPLMIKRETSLPPAAVCIPLWRDVSGATLTRQYYTTKEFKRYIAEIVDHIEKVAEAMHQRDAQSGCGQFAFPRTSAFANWQSPGQEFPLTGKRASGDSDG